MTAHGHPSPPAAGRRRHFGLDWLRIGAFLLLMLYHVAMVFVTGGWLVKLGQVEWLAFPMLFVAPWRLALLFIVAGFAGRTLLAKLGDGRHFARERTRRLILPLLFAMTLIIPPQSWVSLRFNHGYPHGFGHFLTHDALRVGHYGGVALPGWEHLWFVFYLWAYTMLLAAGLLLLEAAAKVRLAAWFDRLGTGSRLLWLPLLYLVPARVLITFTVGEQHGLFNDWLSDVLYLPCFLFGFGLAGTDQLWPAVRRLWKPALALALASYAVLALVETLYPANRWPPHALMALDRAAMAAMLWTMALVMLRLADGLLNRDHRWRAPLGEAVFPFYIIHQTIIVLTAWWLLPARLPGVLSFALIAAATTAGCWLFYRLGRSLPALAPLIGLSGATSDPSPAGRACAPRAAQP